MCLAIAGVAAASAQKFALVDMEYILRNVPSYEMANEQLNQVSQRWEKEVNEVSKEAETMYKNYQSDMVFLTDDQKKKREEAIVAKEKEATDLRYKYFDSEGELYKNVSRWYSLFRKMSTTLSRRWLKKKATWQYSTEASSQSIVFASPRIDVSNEVLAKLGYSK